MKKFKLWSCLLILAISASFAVTISAQPSSSANFTIRQATLSNGGGHSTSTNFTLTGTPGQAVAGTISASPQFSLAGGFHQPGLAPTAALVSISGRVLTPKDRGIHRAVVVMTDQFGVRRYGRTNPFGYFHFNAIEVGQTVILTVQSKGYRFSPQVFTLDENIGQIVFVALSSKVLSK